MANGFLCPSCSKTSLVSSPEECVVCRRPSERYVTHPHCLPQTSLQQVIICWQYNKSAKRIISQIKTQLHYGIVKNLVSYALETARAYLPNQCVFVPVPTSQQRVRARGFNQTVIIARELGKLAGIEILDILKKEDTAEHQSGKSRKQRALLDSSQFSLKFSHSFSSDSFRRSSVLRRPIVLIDDICTTGTTLNACATILRQAGYVDISGLALFRGKNHSSLGRKSLPLKINPYIPQDEQLEQLSPHEEQPPIPPQLLPPHL